MTSFFGELRRRNVVKVAVAYAIVAWLIVQIIVSVEGPLSLPDSTDTLVIVFLAIGFVVATFLAWAYELTPEGMERTKSVPLAESIARVTGRKLDFVIIGALVLALGFVILDAYVLRDFQVETVEVAEPTTLPNSVAVLPLDNLSPNPDDAYFAAGMHEEILNQLSKLGSLSVISRTSVLRYRNNRPPIPEIAAALNVEAVMEGSVRYAGNRIIVTVQLIDAATDAHIWSESYPGDLSDLDTVFALQADIAMNVANALQAEFSSADLDRLATTQTESSAAYALYLRAREARNGSQGIGEAIEFLDEAIAIDPNYAEAYAHRGYLYGVSLILVDLSTPSNPLSYEDVEARVFGDAEHALMLDPNNGTAYRALGNANTFSWRWSEAEAAFERAVELSPSDQINLGNITIFKGLLGKHDEALQWARRIDALNPTGPVGLRQLGNAYLAAGNPENAVLFLEDAVQRAPAASAVRFALAKAQIRQGNETDAEASLRISEQLLGDGYESGNTLVERAYAYSRIGRLQDARRLYQKFETWTSTNRAGAGMWALAYLAIGDYNQALEWLERSAEKVAAFEGDEGHFAIAVIRTNRYADPVLERSEFVAVRSRLYGR